MSNDQTNDSFCSYHFARAQNSTDASGSSALRYNSRYSAQTDAATTSQRAQGQFGTLTRRHRPSLDYASDTEATCSSSPRSAYYYYRHNMNNPAQSSAVSHLATLSRSQIGQSSSGLRSNSLPRSGRTLPQQPGLRTGLGTVTSGLIDQEDSDGALSAPELPSIRRDRGSTVSYLFKSNSQIIQLVLKIPIFGIAWAGSCQIKTQTLLLLFFNLISNETYVYARLTLNDRREDTVFPECLHIRRVQSLVDSNPQHECPVRADQSDDKPTASLHLQR